MTTPTPRKRRAAKVTKEWEWFACIPSGERKAAKWALMVLEREGWGSDNEIRRLPRRKADGGGRR